MNSTIAKEKLCEQGVEKLDMNYGAQAGEVHMDSMFMLSLYLASEKNKGSYSEWYPWIRTLPPKPPCAWFMSDLELQATLKQIQQADNNWVTIVQQSRQVVDYLCAQLMYNVKGKLQVQPHDIKWALGHVMSRGISPMQNIDDKLQFSSGKMEMIPYIDLINHHDEAALPIGRGDDVAVFSVVGGSPKALTAGEELFIQYICGNSALETFVKLGFVPNKFK
eukprot:TRINITY_DN14809_c0_g1_i1.p1 TRINITY_DN14809_c0_g1~~TRINITY_DN14809_c0_g1_i1.p1  ORF type:complete len:221 (-),score=34.84 TRINITY_DN14809_c0_g1_i1:158-820(-)